VWVHIYDIHISTDLNLNLHLFISAQHLPMLGDPNMLIYLSIYTCLSIYVSIYVSIHLSIYIERERERSPAHRKPPFLAAHIKRADFGGDSRCLEPPTPLATPERVGSHAWTRRDEFRAQFRWLRNKNEHIGVWRGRVNKHVYIHIHI